MDKRATDHGRAIAAAFLAACAAFTSPSIARAEVISADATVVVVEPVGAGFSFDILSDAVSAVFLNGDVGDSVSLLLSRSKPGPRSTPRNEGGVLVMASGVYRIDLLQPVASHARLHGALRGAAPGGSSILFLAQFN